MSAERVTLTSGTSGRPQEVRGIATSHPGVSEAYTSAVSDIELAREREEHLRRRIRETEYRDRSFVYFVECRAANAIKIGRSTDPRCRLEALQAGCPMKLHIVCRVRGGAQEESDLHHRFRRLRIHGEWFRAEPELIDFILSLTPEEPIDTTPLWFSLESARKDRELAELRALLAQKEAAE